MRPLYRFHSSGRWLFGSHWPKSSRNENTRSFARARSSSRRAPPNAASKPCSAIASSSVTVCSWLRDARGPVSSTTRPRVDRVLHARHDQPLAELRHAAVAELDHLGEVVPGVDVHQRERERRRAERLLGEPQQHDRVLAAAEQQHRPLEFGRDLAHHVDRLGLERAQVAELGVGRDAHSPTLARRAGRTRSSRCPPSGPRGRCPAACRARSRSTRSPGRGAGCRAGRARGCAATGPVGPVGERVVLPQPARLVAFDRARRRPASGPARGGSP